MRIAGLTLLAAVTLAATLTARTQAAAVTSEIGAVIDSLAAAGAAGSRPGRTERELHLRDLAEEAELLHGRFMLFAAKIDKEIADRAASPCENALIAYCFTEAIAAGRELSATVDEAVDAGSSILACGALGVGGDADGRDTDISMVVSLVSRLGVMRGMIDDRSGVIEDLLAEYGCDEEELERLADRLVPGGLDPLLLQDGGTMIEIAGDGVDNDADGLLEEDWNSVAGYNVAILLFDSEGPDDVLDLFVTGVGDLGRTPPGGLRTYGLNLPPGTYTATVTAVRAPDGVGNFTLVVRERGVERGRIAVGLEEGASISVDFTVTGR